jgi:hypothetical protein
MVPFVELPVLSRPMVPGPVLAPPVPIVVLPPDAAGKPDPGQTTTPGRGAAPPAPPAQRERPECRPVPVPHRGGDAIHNMCADTFPPNRFPEMDVFVNNKAFDALQANANVLWEIKTDRYDQYPDFLKQRVVRNQAVELRSERDAARSCGYGFVVGVSRAAHRDALLREAPELTILVTGC